MYAYVLITDSDIALFDLLSDFFLSFHDEMLKKALMQ